MNDLQIIKNALKIVQNWDNQSGGFEDTIKGLKYMIKEGIWGGKIIKSKIKRESR